MPSLQPGAGHSRYSRCLQDLPWQGVSVQLWLTRRAGSVAEILAVHGRFSASGFLGLQVLIPDGPIELRRL